MAKPRAGTGGDYTGHSSRPPGLPAARGCVCVWGVIMLLSASNMCPMNSGWSRMKLLSEGLRGWKEASLALRGT